MKETTSGNGMWDLDVDDDVTDRMASYIVGSAKPLQPA
jgi:hypothetical protein